MPNPDAPKPDPAASVGDAVGHAAAPNVARKAAEAAVAGAVSAVGKAADSALDAVETFFFGKVGGAQAELDRDAGRSALDRLRAEAGAPTDTRQTGRAPVPAQEDPVELAKRQLAELKRQRDTPPPERKKTM